MSKSKNKNDSGAIGLDFGTTNSAVARVSSGGAELVPLPTSAVGAAHWRSVLFFEVGDDGRPAISAGPEAIARYVETGGEGRLVQSMKSYLASALFSKTQILGRQYGLDELISIFLLKVRAGAKSDLGSRVVVGRPVRYWGAESEEDDARAVARMRSAMTLAGFSDVVFEFEPVAAAARYAEREGGERLILVADFGGGTTDFSLVRVAPDSEPGDPRAVVATGGLGVGGDSFDSRIIDNIVAPRLGRGTAYRDEFGAQAPVPTWLYSRLRRWHHLSFLRSKKTTALLERVERGADDADSIAAFRRIIDEELGLSLHQSVEGTKVSLSEKNIVGLDFEPASIAAALTRGAFESWIEPELESIDGVLDKLLADANLAASDVDRVFATGGSSLVPAVRARLAQRFGEERLQGGEELTSVGQGLALRARHEFTGA